MKISDIINCLENLAHPSLQEHYDNTGLLTGNESWECKGILVCLDTTEPVIQEAVQKNCNLIVAHHPLIFSGLKKINHNNYVGKAVIAAIKNDIAIYAIHTSLDNVIKGVNGKIASKLGLEKISILSLKNNALKKIYTFVPSDKADHVRGAIFAAGAGHIGNYSECSFNVDGEGTFKAGQGANPYVGEAGKLHKEKEVKIEAIFPAYIEYEVIKNLKEAHPYQEPAFDVITLANNDPGTGSGLSGELKTAVSETDFIQQLKQVFGLSVIRHSAFRGRPVKKIAVCGGAGSFLIPKALAAGADFYITADIKYHDFFEANDRMVIADIGHFESEQFTIDLIKEVLEQKFPTFAVLKTGINTNPVHYFI